MEAAKKTEVSQPWAKFANQGIALASGQVGFRGPGKRSHSTCADATGQVFLPPGLQPKAGGPEYRAARARASPTRPTAQPPHPGPSRVGPTPERGGAAQVEDLAALGIVRTRAHSIVTLAEEVASGRLNLEAGAPPEPTVKQLIALPGIGNNALTRYDAIHASVVEEIRSAQAHVPA